MVPKPSCQVAQTGEGGAQWSPLPSLWTSRVGPRRGPSSRKPICLSGRVHGRRCSSRQEALWRWVFNYGAAKITVHLPCNMFLQFILYAPNCLDFWHQAKTVQKNWLKLVLCLQILNLDWTTLWNHLNSLPNGHSGVRMVLDLFWTSKSGKCSQKSPKQNSPLILLQNFGTPIIFWKSQFFGSF